MVSLRSCCLASQALGGPAHITKVPLAPIHMPDVKGTPPKPEDLCKQVRVAERPPGWNTL